MADTMLALFNEISFCELFPPWNMREKTGRPSVGPPESENVIKHRGKEKGVGRAARCPRKMGKRKTPPERGIEFADLKCFGFSVASHPVAS